jgi:hypothetical protein
VAWNLIKDLVLILIIIINMLKNLSLALVGLVATASATHVYHEADVMNPMNFLRATTPANLFKNVVDQIQGKQLTNPLGVVSWGNCASSVSGNWVLDESNTYASPEPATKGNNVNLNLAGLFNQATTVTNVDINVAWDNTPLHTEDHPVSIAVAANGPFSYTLAWFIPGFAPSGHYHVIITLDQNVGQSVGCVTADFDL